MLDSRLMMSCCWESIFSWYRVLILSISCCHFKNVVADDSIKRCFYWLEFEKVKEIIQFIKTVCETENECTVETWSCWIIEVIKTSEVLKKKCRLKACSCALFKINIRFNQKLSCVSFIIHSTLKEAHQW